VIIDAQKNGKLAAALPPVIAPVRGNGDADYYSNAVGEKPATFRINIPSRLVFKAAGRTVFVSHGHKHAFDFGTGTLAAAGSIMDADMMFFGHTHRPFVNASQAELILNPGSCIRPRGGFPPTFALVAFPGPTEAYTVLFYEIKQTSFGGEEFVRFSM
jgi:putative phosphoesterase